MKLLLVESPSKAKTIGRFLDPEEYTVESTFGHIRDLPAYKMGIDTEKDFEPQYVVSRKRQPIVKKIKGLAEKSKMLVIATDEDREGEAIGWHILEIMNSAGLKKEYKRIVFHEITKSAIEEALKNPRLIDESLVSAQKARRILDRLVGYKLSPFLWKKLMAGLSAGRVQSVTLRLIVEREKEVAAFCPEIYYTIEALLKDNKKGAEFPALLKEINKDAIAKPGIKNKEEAENILRILKTAEWTLKNLEKKALVQRPRPPFTTSTMTQEAYRFYKFSAKKTMFLAQQLYEGVKLKKEGGLVGLITYMRTDSVNIAEAALVSARNLIAENFGEKYLPSQPRKYKKISKLAQEAHEAIRPTNPERFPEKIKDDLSPDQFKLYNLIWQRFSASQMNDALFESTAFDIEAKTQKDICRFSANGQVLRFDGFLKVYPLKTEETILPALEKGANLNLLKISMNEHQTKPPPRYNEASLIKTLEKFGIGRPSTYAPIISILLERNYVEKNSAKSFTPTEIGFKINEILTTHFPNIVDINFTAKMESDLDDIAQGKTDWLPVVKNFYEPFAETLAKKYEEVKKEIQPESAGRQCPQCQKELLIRQSRFGKFIACSGFPECRYKEKLNNDQNKMTDIPCLGCGQGRLIERRNRRGQVFYGCTRYPECKHTSSKKAEAAENTDA